MTRTFPKPMPGARSTTPASTTGSPSGPSGTHVTAMEEARARLKLPKIVPDAGPPAFVPEVKSPEPEPVAVAEAAAEPAAEVAAATVVAEAAVETAAEAAPEESKSE